MLRRSISVLHRRKKRAVREKNYADTMMQAAGFLGVPIAVIQAAKESGCKAFRHSRVYLAELKEWLAKNPEAVERAIRISEIEERQKTADAEISEERARRLRKESIHVDMAKRTVMRHGMELKFKTFAIAKRVAPRFAIEADPIVIEEKLNAEFRQVFNDISKGEWRALICPHCNKEIKIDT